MGRGPENTVPSMPHLFYAELGVLMLTVLVCLALALVSDAPLKELANPSVPENPAKAPWYFLGLQELVSFSAFMGGIGIPAIVLLGLGLIPYLDRERRGHRRWFGGPGGRRAGAAARPSSGSADRWPSRRSRSASAGCASGSRDIPQLIITAVNPGTILTTIYALYSLWLIRSTNRSARALGLFTCFLCGFLVLTIIGTYFRGPELGLLLVAGRLAASLGSAWVVARLTASRRRRCLRAACEYLQPYNAGTSACR